MTPAPGLHESLLTEALASALDALGSPRGFPVLLSATARSPGWGQPLDRVATGDEIMRSCVG